VRTVAAAAVTKNQEPDPGRAGVTCGEEAEGRGGVEVDGGGDGGGAVYDGVLAREDDLAGRAGAYLHRSPVTVARRGSCRSDQLLSEQPLPFP